MRLLAALAALCAAFTLAVAGAPMVAYAEGVDVSVSVYRLYNQWSGEHLFTTDKGEYDSLQALGWHGEGTAWKSPSVSDTPVYRLYNQWSGDHHYTMDEEEYDHLGQLGWNQEGTLFYSADAV